MKRSVAILGTLLGVAWLCACASGARVGGGTPAWKLPPPPPKEAPVVQPGALHRMQLQNGPGVIVLEDRRLPLVVLGVAVPRGAASERLEEAGVAAYMAEVMRRGAGGRDALALARAVDEIGASLAVGSDWDNTSVVVSGLSRDLDLLLEILADVALRPAFAADEAKRARDEQLAALAKAKDDPATLVRWHAMGALYPEHRFGTPSEGRAETVARLDASAARAFHRRLFVPDGAVLFASGDVDAGDLETRLRTVFGPDVWKVADRAPASPAPPERVPPGRRIVVVDKPDLAQARITVAHEGLARTDPARVTADIMNKVLGGSGFASRLMQRVRADEGLTYGVGSGFDLRRQPGPYRIGTFTRAEAARRVVDLLLEEMERIRQEPPTADELAKAKSLAVGRFGLGLETSEAVLSALVDLDLYGLPQDSLDTYRSRVRAVDVEAAAASARDLIHPERAAIVVLGPATVLVPQLESLGSVEVVQP